MIYPLSTIHRRRWTSNLAAFWLLIWVPVAGQTWGGEVDISILDGIDGNLARPGDSGFRILTPTVLELGLVNTQPQGGPPDSWNFVTGSGALNLPPNSVIQVKVDGVVVSASYAGFRRRALYAPLAPRDLRVDNRLFLSVIQPIAEGSSVEVKLTNADGPTSGIRTFTGVAGAGRFNAALHVNQEGFGTLSPKVAAIGYFLGSGGELSVPSGVFSIVNRANGQVAYQGTLSVKPDVGFLYQPKPYQSVAAADFSALQTPGLYELRVPGMGASMPFRIGDGLPMLFARTYALGMYNQRCGQAVALPYSRDVHAACHTATASIPASATDFSATWGFIAAANADYASNPRHTAPRLGSPAAQLYPFVKTGTIDVSGGHHDAGDYSKYTIDSAQVVHHLVFAADSFPGAGALDNLGTPESGDGKSDLLQEAKVEADFLAKMQDDDGGFFFLVYPKTRKYEDTVLPDHGDPQVVWPKNTSATAAATAALAEIGSSPLFKQQYPAEAAVYLQKANAGWNFLMNAIAARGKDGSYQKITHYGDVFMHDDELAWAAAAMFAATGDPAFQQQLIAWYNPTSSATRRWSWWRLFEGYGGAARTYVFAARSGRVAPGIMNAAYLASCEAEIVAAGEDVWKQADQSAYGVSFQGASKAQKTAGWFFPSEQAFDLTVAYQLRPLPKYEAAVMSNLNYELGCNPLNIAYLTGVGSRRQREIVSQYARNDERMLPPSGLPLGAVQAGPPWLSNYGADLGTLNFPSDGATVAPYPFYDRWMDTFNTMTEAVISQQARSLASLAFWAARTPLASQSGVVATAAISAPTGYVPVGQAITVSLQCPGLDLTDARVVWESSDQEVTMGGTSWTFTPVAIGTQWIEAEATLPDGRRVAASVVYRTRKASGAAAFAGDADTIALYHFDGNSADSSGNGYHLTPAGGAAVISDNLGWMGVPAGGVARLNGLGDVFSVVIPDSVIEPGSQLRALTLEAWIYPRAYKAWSVDNYPVISIYQSWDTSLEMYDGKWNSPGVPLVRSGGTTITSSATFAGAVRLGTWQHLRMVVQANGTAVTYLDGVVIGSTAVTMNVGRSNGWTLTLGNISADIDEVRLSRIARTDPLPVP
jgi:hypothetical protein